MISRSRLPTRIALLGAVVLVLSKFQLALSGAGPYKSTPTVQAGITVGISLAYFASLLLASRIAISSWALSSPGRTAKRKFLALVGGTSTFLAPLMSVLALATVCQSQSLCPAAANPISWAHLKLFTELPFLPFAVGAAVVLIASIGSSTRHGHNVA